MRVVVDSNIAFSTILNSNSRIAHILLHPKSRRNFYSTNHLVEEIEEHLQERGEIIHHSKATSQAITVEDKTASEQILPIAQR